MTRKVPGTMSRIIAHADGAGTSRVSEDDVGMQARSCQI